MHKNAQQKNAHVKIFWLLQFWRTHLYIKDEERLTWFFYVKKIEDFILKTYIDTDAN